MNKKEKEVFNPLYTAITGEKQKVKEDVYKIQFREKNSNEWEDVLTFVNEDQDYIAFIFDAIATRVLHPGDHLRLVEGD